MARSFGEYDPEVPLGITWDEVFEFLDEDGNPVDLTDCDVRAQFRRGRVLRDPGTGAGDSDPLFEVVTRTDLYPEEPAWPLISGFQVGADPDGEEEEPDPADGTILMRVAADETWLLSPTNEKGKVHYDIEIIDGDEVIPLLQGVVIVLPRTTLGLPA